MIERIIKFTGWILKDLFMLALSVYLGTVAYAKAPEFFRALAVVSLCIMLSGFIMVWIWARWDQTGE